MNNSRKIMKTLILSLLTMLIISCGSNGSKTEEKNVLNEGTTIVENGKGLNDTIPFKCIGCKENLSLEMFEKVKNESSKIAKNNLNNPLSFIPQSMDIVLIKEDSLYSFETNKKIDSVITVLTTYKYIGQNAYGTEMSSEQLISFYLVNGLISDISESVKLEDLKFEEKSINRTLSLSYNTSFIEIIPTKDKSLIVKSSVSCVDEGTWLLIKLLNGDEIKLVSWNDFNCEGTSYFRWFTKQQIEKLKTNKIESISVVDDKSVAVIVPKNKSDYFIQLLNLYK
jgi:hypothetical protein